MSEPLSDSTKICPACGKPNVCAIATDPTATDCWCRAIPSTPDLLSGVKEQYPESSCLCRDCLKKKLAELREKVE